MARQARLALPGYPHHLQIRGNDGRSVFADEDDRLRFLGQLRDVVSEHKLSLHAYVLLPSEVRFLVTPPAAQSLSRAIQSLGRRYVAAFNARHRRTGTLWEGRFRAHLVSGDLWVLRVMRHIESRAVPEAHLASWPSMGVSSLAHHLGACVDPLITEPGAYWAMGNTPFEREAHYRAWMEHGGSASEDERIASCLRGGRPLADAPYLADLERVAQRSFAPRPRGRPRKLSRESDPI